MRVVAERKHIWSPITWKIVDSGGDTVAGGYATRAEARDDLRRIELERKRNADRVDGYDRDDLGESPDF